MKKWGKRKWEREEEGERKKAREMNENNFGGVRKAEIKKSSENIVKLK